VPVSMMVPWQMGRSTIAAHSRGSVKVSVQPEKDWLDAIATEFFSSRSVRTWKRSAAPRRAAPVQFHVAELVDLCGYPHRLIYAEPATMPRTVLGALLFGCVAGRSAPWGTRSCRHSYRPSRKASILSVGW